MAHRSRNIRMLWMAGGALVLIAGAWVAQALMTPPAEEGSVTNMTTQTLDVRPQLIDTSDALSRYVDNLTTGSVTQVSSQHIYYAQNVDWNIETVVAIQFTVMDAKTVTAASIQTIDGESAYVIDVLGAPQCGAVPQVDSLRVAFIKQSGRDTKRPVILRTTPNTASCPDELR